jgi:BolA family transcriptional regulator, general stress-responsive regulator
MPIGQAGLAGGQRVARIRAAIEAQLAPLQVTVDDESAAHAGHAGAREGGHFRVLVVSHRFRGCSMIERHRLVYQAVASLMGEIHALAISAKTPEEMTS